MASFVRSESLSVQWPYKHLWNTLRGESILADDEVILQELRQSYEQIVRGLTQYQLREADLEDEGIGSSTGKETTDVGDKQSTDTAKSLTGEDQAKPTEAPTQPTSSKDEKNNEIKLRKRISIYLDLETTVAWEIFCSYMMFEYKGGSTSYEKLLESHRVSNEFLADLKAYYMNERISVLLCIQALFGHHDDTSHKYNHIFRAFGEWADENGISDLTENLLKSLELSKNEDEEVQTLHALTLLMHQMPHLALKPFVAAFKGFTPGHKEDIIQCAEAALMYTVFLLPAFDEEWPASVSPLIQNLLTKHGEDLLLNKFCVGGIIAAYVNMCNGDDKIRKMLTTSPFPSTSCIPSITQLARFYSDSSVQCRHNLPTVVLKSLYYTVKALYEKLDRAIPSFGSKSDFYDFLIVALKHKEIAIKFLTTTQDLMDLVTEALILFPVDIKHLLEMWASMCETADKKEDALGVLDDCVKLVTYLSEYNSEAIMIMTEDGACRAQEEILFSGVRIPAGTEALVTRDINMVTWDLKAPIGHSVWTVIYQQVLDPVLKQIDREKTGLHSPTCSSPISCDGASGDNIRAVFSFLKRFAKVSNIAPNALHDLYEPATYILMKSMEHTSALDEKAEMVANIVELVAGGDKLGSGSARWTGQYIRSVWPDCGVDPSTIVSQLIMGYESVATNQCKVTLAFLDATLACFQERDDKITLEVQTKMEVTLNAIHFINENIFHSFTRWRMDSHELKCKVLLRCLRIYNGVFRLHHTSPAWQNLRINCSRSLLANNSSLMAAFNTDDEQLQNSVIRPTKNNYLMPEIIYESLALLLNLFKFQKETIQLVDATLGSTLVQKLGRFARHRLDYKIPTLAMALLKKIAEELNMSLLSCFGSDEVAFRELILQRLEFRSEDVNLKVAILEFLTISAFNQPGLIQYIFMDDFLAEKIVELPTEKDEGLALSVLTFIRAMVHKGAIVIKKCKNLWSNVFTPIRRYQSGGRLQIITVTLQIATIELFRNGLTDSKFATEIKWLLNHTVFMRLYKMLVFDQEHAGSEEGILCLRSFNHFMSVVLRRNDMEDIFEEKTKMVVMESISTALFNNEMGEENSSQRVLVYVETMSLLVTAIKLEKDFIDRLSQYLLMSFPTHSISVRIGLLYLTHELLSRQTEELHATTTENIIRMMYELFDKVVQVLNYEQLKLPLKPVVMLAATIVNIIISKGNTVFPNWLRIFEDKMLASIIVLLINQGLKWVEGAEVVGQLVLVLRSLADVENGAKLLHYSDVTTKLLLPIVKYAANASDGSDGPWGKVYVLAINILGQMIYRQRYYYLEDGLTVWGVHGEVIGKQLMSLSNMSQECVSIKNPESNFKRMRNLLTFNVIALDAIHSMLPFQQHWKQISPGNYHHLMVGVFGSLQTAINLLEQPTYLHTVINSITASPTRSPHITELQAKLWEVVYICSHILWAVRSDMLDFVAADQLRLTVNQVTQACIKALTKVPHGTKGVSSSTPAANVTQFPTPSSRTAMTLERSLALIHYMVSTFFSDHVNIPNAQKRLLATDVTMMIDGVKRVSGHTSDPNFCLQLMNALEELIKYSEFGIILLKKGSQSTVDECDIEISNLTRQMQIGNLRTIEEENAKDNSVTVARKRVRFSSDSSSKCSPVLKMVKDSFSAPEVSVMRAPEVPVMRAPEVPVVSGPVRQRRFELLRPATIIRPTPLRYRSSSNNDNSTIPEEASFQSHGHYDGGGCGENVKRKNLNDYQNCFPRIETSLLSDSSKTPKRSRPKIIPH